METTINKWGNSLAVRLPKSALQSLKLSEGTKINLTVKNGKIVIEPKRKTLEELVAGITPENRPDPEDYDWGPPVGEEIW